LAHGPTGSSGLWYVARQKHHGGRAWKRKDAHLVAVRKQRERQEGFRDKKPFKGTPSVTASSS
jgi:hypothetical protein